MEQHSHMPTFMYISGNDGKEFILNLNLVRMVDQIAAGHIRLLFGERHIVTLTGEMANEVLSLLVNNCIVSNGMPFPEFMERLRSVSPSLGQNPIPSQEP